MPGTSVPESRRRRALIALVAAATLAVAVAAVAIAGSGGDDASGTDAQFTVAEDVEPLGQIRAGSVAQLADCEDWEGGDVERRKATVIDLREQLSGGGTLEGTPSISDQDAYDVFERACANDFTAAFQLYKIYFRAAAFNNYDPSQFTQP